MTKTDRVPTSGLSISITGKVIKYLCETEPSSSALRRPVLLALVIATAIGGGVFALTEIFSTLKVDGLFVRLTAIFLGLGIFHAVQYAAKSSHTGNPADIAPQVPKTKKDLILLFVKTMIVVVAFVLILFLATYLFRNYLVYNNGELPAFLEFLSN